MNLRVAEVEKTVEFNSGKVTEFENEFPKVRKALKDEIEKLDENLH